MSADGSGGEAHSHHQPRTDDAPPSDPGNRPFPVGLVVIGVLGAVVLVGIGLIAVIAALVIPTLATIREKSRIQENNHNLKCIVEGQIMFAAKNRGEWARPQGYEHGTGPEGMPGDAREAVPFVGQCYLLLARHNELSPRLFIHPGNPSRMDLMSGGPHSLDDARIADLTPGDVPDPLAWAASYAYDYACPTNPASSRPVVGDRDPAIWGGKLACVAYGGGHVATIDVQPGASDTVTVVAGPELGGPVAYAAYSVENYQPDNLYAADAGEVLVWRPGSGSSTLAWLR